jgi:hypothetical protein
MRDKEIHYYRIPYCRLKCHHNSTKNLKNFATSNMNPEYQHYTWEESDMNCKNLPGPGAKTEDLNLWQHSCEEVQCRRISL